MRRRVAEAMTLAAACILAGCGIAPRFAPQAGMADRCADLMKRADPFADIEITKREAVALSLTTIVAKVEGMRADLPPHAPVSRRLAIECRFESGVLTSFRWEKGPG